MSKNDFTLIINKYSKYLVIGIIVFEILSLIVVSFTNMKIDDLVSGLNNSMRNYTIIEYNLKYKIPYFRIK